MKKKFFYFFITFLFVVLLCFISVFVAYFHRQNENKSMISYCSKNNTDDCYTRMFEILLPKMLVNKVWIDGAEINLISIDWSSRVDSVYALKKSDALMGYGVQDEVCFENSYSNMFNKTSYTFDCGLATFDTGDDRVKFYSECIASDKFLIENQLSTGNVHTLEQKLKQLNLWDKKVFVKMDVAEADVVALPEIINNADKITGFNIALHIRNSNAITERLPILDLINEKFVLVSRNSLYVDDNFRDKLINSKYYKGTITDGIMYLSYINKDLVDKYEVSNIQNSDKLNKNVKKLLYKEQRAVSDVSYVVTFTEKIKSFLKGK